MSLDALKKAIHVPSKEAMNTHVEPDPIIYNADIKNTKQRPFTVCKKEYPFKSHWYNRNGVDIHYVDEGEEIPIVLTHGNPEWSFFE